MIKSSKGNGRYSVYEVLPNLRAKTSENGGMGHAACSRLLNVNRFDLDRCGCTCSLYVHCQRRSVWHKRRSGRDGEALARKIQEGWRGGYVCSRHGPTAGI